MPKHYRIVSILGTGTFGVVFKCRNTISFDEDGNESILAVKAFHEADLDRPLKDLFGEANILKNLVHANIIRVIEHGYAEQESQQRPFLAMEYFPGITLEEHLTQHGRLSFIDFTIIFQQIGCALHAAHSGVRPVFHRDLKPANIMIRIVNELWEVKVIDFGLAVRVPGQGVPSATLDNRGKSIAGTIKYSAPEQFGDRPYPVGPYSDVFAFGKTALHALLGTTEPKSRHWELLSPDERNGVRVVLERCTEEELGESLRYQSFVPILQSIKLKPITPDVNRIRLAGHRFDLSLPNGAKMTFAWCPPGSFLMGDAKGWNNEKPLHNVSISTGFFIGIYPVTQIQGIAVMGGNPSHFVDDLRPVEQITWHDAQEFCLKLGSLMEDQIKFRLPTEAEWEYACRAGTATQYANGSDPDDLNRIGWFAGNSEMQTHRVGRKEANPWGLFDMHGNTWEMCHDWYDPRYYSSSPNADPCGPEHGSSTHVMRGGSWDIDGKSCSSSFRLMIEPNFSSSNTGFRVVFNLK